jgi:hypothetical protein
MTFYARNPKVWTTNLLEVIKGFSSIAGYKIISVSANQ